MSKLIIPEKPSLVVPSRRSFLKMTGAAAAVLAGDISAPMICNNPDWLMQINTKMNRLVFAFRDEGRIIKAGDTYVPSLLSLTDFTDPIVRQWWENKHRSLRYDIVRWGDIHPYFEKRYGGSSKPFTPERYKDNAKALEEDVTKFKASDRYQILAAEAKKLMFA